MQPDWRSESDAAAIRTSLTQPQVFTTVFERHFAAVHGYAARRLGAELAQEIAAETFARAYERRHRYDFARPDARPWLLGIAANMIRRHWRTERRRIAAHARATEPPGSADHGAAIDVAGALHALSARDREALLLFVWADLSYEEISAAMSVPIGTVRSRIARARRVLGEQLGPRPSAILSPRENTDV